MRAQLPNNRSARVNLFFKMIHFNNKVLWLFLVFVATVLMKVVIPAKAGIQCFQGSLDAGSGPA